MVVREQNFVIFKKMALVRESDGQVEVSVKG